MTFAARATPHFAANAECVACPYSTPCVTVPPGKQKGHRITADSALDCIYRGLAPDGSVRQILDMLQEQVRTAADARYGGGTGDKLTGGLANVRGDWLEQVLGLLLWNIVADSHFGNTAIVKLPNATILPFLGLYSPQAQGYLEDLFASLKTQDISLTMSNPDFVCVTNLPEEIAASFRTPLKMGKEAASTMASAWELLRGICDPFSVPFVLAVKSSIRPDRRYQIVHEANTVKALVAHLASRYWDKDLYTAFYALIADTVSDQDRMVLRNPATHTLVQVAWTPAPVVDGVLELDSVSEASADMIKLITRHVAPITS